MRRDLDVTIVFVLIAAIMSIAAATPVLAQGMRLATISQPPATAVAGAAFDVTETVWNNGTSQSGGGLTQVIVLESVTLPMRSIVVGTRSIPGLAAGAHSTVTTTVTIPAETAAGIYRLLVGTPVLNYLTATGTVAIVRGTSSGRQGVSAAPRAP